MIFPDINRLGERKHDDDHLVIGSSVTPINVIELYNYRKDIEKVDDKLVLANRQAFGKELIDISWLEGASETYNISPDPKDYALADIPILTVDFPNRNLQGFPFEEVSYFDPLYGSFVYRTFVGKPTYVNHNNKVPQNAKGAHFDSSLQYIPKWNIWKIRVLTGWDRSKDPTLANKIIKNKHVGFSMGSYVDSFLPLSRDSMVKTEYGLLPIQEVEPGTIVETGEFQRKSGGIIYQGYDQVCEIKTKRGFSLGAQLTHPVLTLDSDLNMRDLQAQEIKKGMFIAVRKKESNLWPEKLLFNDFIPVEDIEIDDNAQVQCQICGESYHQLYSHLNARHAINQIDYKQKFNVNIVSTINYSYVDYPKEMTPELARIIGHAIGDGCVTARYRITYANNKKYLIEDFVDCVEKTFGILPKITHRNNNYHAQFGNMGISKFLKYLGLSPTDSLHNEIPWSIMQAPRECIVEFIKVFWEDDGSARAINEGISFHSTSDKLMKQMQLLLLNLGIPTWFFERKEQIRFISNKHYKLKMYNLACYGDMADKFIDVIGAMTEERYTELMKLKKKRQLTQWHDVIPFAKQAVDKLYENRHLGNGNYNIDGRNRKLFLYRLQLKDGTVYCYKHFEKYNKLLPNIKILDPALGDKLQKIYNSGYMWEEVDSNNESAILQQVYCIKDVEEDHNFTANGIVVHNCSNCGALHSNKQPCNCIKMGRGSIIDGKLAYQVCIGACFFETSEVDDPADVTAYGNIMGYVL